MPKILVTYATKYGSTAGVAQIIGQTLQEEGAGVDVLPVKEVKDVQQYHAVIVGSGIYMGKWLPEAVKFVEDHKQPLEKRPVAYFVVCATMKDDNEANRKTASSFSNQACAIVKPVDTGLFAGAVDFKKMGAFTRFMMKKMMKAPEGDFRNEEAIKAWTKDVYQKIK